MLTLAVILPPQPSYHEPKVLFGNIDETQVAVVALALFTWLLMFLPKVIRGGLVGADVCSIA